MWQADRAPRALQQQPVRVMDPQQQQGQVQFGQFDHHFADGPEVQADAWSDRAFASDRLSRERQDERERRWQSTGPR